MSQPVSANCKNQRSTKLADIMREQEVYEKKIEELQNYPFNYLTAHGKHLKRLKSICCNFSKNQNQITELMETFIVETFWELKKTVEMSDLFSTFYKINQRIKLMRIELKSEYPNEYGGLYDNYCDCPICLFVGCSEDFVTKYKRLNPLYTESTKIFVRINALKKEIHEYMIKSSKYKSERDNKYKEIENIIDVQKITMDGKLQYKQILMIGRQQDPSVRIFFLGIGDTYKILFPNCWDIVFDYLRAFDLKQILEHDLEQVTDQELEQILSLEFVNSQSLIVNLPDHPTPQAKVHITVPGNEFMDFIITSRREYMNYFSQFI